MIAAYIRRYPGTVEYLFLAVYTMLYLSMAGLWTG